MPKFDITSSDVKSFTDELRCNHDDFRNCFQRRETRENVFHYMVVQISELEKKLITSDTQCWIKLPATRAKEYKHKGEIRSKVVLENTAKKPIPGREIALNLNNYLWYRVLSFLKFYHLNCKLKKQLDLFNATFKV